MSRKISYFIYLLLLFQALILLPKSKHKSLEQSCCLEYSLKAEGQQAKACTLNFNPSQSSVLRFSLINRRQPVSTPTKIVKLKIFDTEVIVNTYQYVRKSPVTFVALHHNEQTGLNLVKEIIQRRSGRLIELVSKKNDSPQRYLFFEFKEKTFCVDPNRIYSKVGIENDLKDEQSIKPCSPPAEDEIKDVSAEVNKFAESLLDQFLPRKRCARNQKFERRLCNRELIVAVHNNTNSGLSIESYMQGEEEAKTTEAVYIVNMEDVDNFFLVTNRKLFNRLININDPEKQFNITLQKQFNIGTDDDGSLSILCGNKRIDYINVEAEHSDGSDRQRIMLNTVLDLFSTR